MEKQPKATAHIGKTHYATELHIGEHILMADEPKDSGGKNLGPDPSAFLAASLASCTAITLRMYADRKGWDLSHADIGVNLERDPGANITRISRDIKLFGNLDEAQQERLLIIANKCPIHQVLSNKIEISSTLVVGT